MGMSASRKSSLSSINHFDDDNDGQNDDKTQVTTALDHANTADMELDHATSVATDVNRADSHANSFTTDVNSHANSGAINYFLNFSSNARPWQSTTTEAADDDVNTAATGSNVEFGVGSVTTILSRPSFPGAVSGTTSGLELKMRVPSGECSKAVAVTVKATATLASEMILN